MATTSPPFVEQNASHSAALFRQTIAALLGRTQPGTLASTAGGVVNPTDLAVAQNATPNMSVNVAGGSCFIPQTLTANGGLYFGFAASTTNLAIAAANATKPRVDLVCATVNDKAYSGSTTNWVLQVVTGVPTAGATLTNLSGAPTIPAASIPLAYVLVPANATSIVTADIKDARRGMQKIGDVVGPAGYPYIVQVGTAQGTTDSFANLTVVFPIPFPTAVVGVIPLTIGTGTAAKLFSFAPIMASATKTSVPCRFFSQLVTGSGATESKSVVVKQTYIAIGY